jgi:isopentenyl-diphosphate delta-isomerase
MGFDAIIATGGIGTGLDVARALALGASAAGIARPILRALLSKKAPGEGRAVALASLDAIEAELRAAMLLTGSRDIAALRSAPRVTLPPLTSWIEQLSRPSRHGRASPAFD